MCTYVACIRGALRMREGHTYIIIGPEQSAKVFSAKFSHCTETRKFSPSKVFRYTVMTHFSNNISKPLPQNNLLVRSTVSEDRADHTVARWVSMALVVIVSL